MVFFSKNDKDEIFHIDDYINLKKKINIFCICCEGEMYAKSKCQKVSNHFSHKKNECEYTKEFNSIFTKNNKCEFHKKWTFDLVKKEYLYRYWNNINIADITNIDKRKIIVRKDHINEVFINKYEKNTNSDNKIIWILNDIKNNDETRGGFFYKIYHDEIISIHYESSGIENFDFEKSQVFIDCNNSYIVEILGKNKYGFGYDVKIIDYESFLNTYFKDITKSQITSDLNVIVYNNIYTEKIDFSQIIDENLMVIDTIKMIIEKYQNYIDILKHFREDYIQKNIQNEEYKYIKINFTEAIDSTKYYVKNDYFKFFKTPDYIPKEIIRILLELVTNKRDKESYSEYNESNGLYFMPKKIKNCELYDLDCVLYNKKIKIKTISYDDECTEKNIKYIDMNLLLFYNYKNIESKINNIMSTEKKKYLESMYNLEKIYNKCNEYEEYQLKHRKNIQLAIEEKKIKNGNWNYKIEQYEKNFKCLKGESYFLYTNKEKSIIQYIINPSGIRGDFNLKDIQITGNGFLISFWEKFGNDVFIKKCYSCSHYYYYKNDPNFSNWDVYYEKEDRKTCRKCYYNFTGKYDKLKIDNCVKGTIINDDGGKIFNITKFCENKCEGCDKKIKYNALEKTPILGMKQMCMNCYNKKEKSEFDIIADENEKIIKKKINDYRIKVEEDKFKKIKEEQKKNKTVILNSLINEKNSKQQELFFIRKQRNDKFENKKLKDNITLIDKRKTIDHFFSKVENKQTKLSDDLIEENQLEIKLESEINELDVKIKNIKSEIDIL